MSDDMTINSVDFDRSPPAKARFDWDAISQQLRAHPMQWAMVFEHGKVSVANAVRQGSINAVHPDYGFEVRTSDNVRGEVRTCTLWLRFNPDKAS